METITNLLKLKVLEGTRTYLALGGLWLASLAEWNGFDVPQFVAMDFLNTLMFSLATLGIYEKAKG